MTDQIYLGDVVHCVGELRTIATNALIDPTHVFGWFQLPSGVRTTYEYGVDSEIVKDAVGVYSFNVDGDTAGNYFFGFYSTGTGKAASVDGRFRVSTSHRV